MESPKRSVLAGRKVQRSVKPRRVAIGRRDVPIRELDTPRPNGGIRSWNQMTANPRIAAAILHGKGHKDQKLTPQSAFSFEGAATASRMLTEPSTERRAMDVEVSVEVLEARPLGLARAGMDQTGSGRPLISDHVEP
jgi:hypothetical protein